MLFEKSRTKKHLLLLRSKLSQNKIFPFVKFSSKTDWKETLNSISVFQKKFIFKIWFLERKDFKIWQDRRFSTPNLTFCKTFTSKSEITKKFWFKTWRVVKILFQNPTRWNFFIVKFDTLLSFHIKIWFCGKKFDSKSIFPRIFYF